MNKKQIEVIKYLSWAINDLVKGEEEAAERDIRWASERLEKHEK